ncbi:MAG TPA: hypothetical protein VKA39_06600 [Beijerinckiaceae bacterium]|nr:hypothetical protein [Beijerinckiaceae bacterium]
MPAVQPVAPGVIAADTITKLPPEPEGAVVVSGSHGGRYPGYLAAKGRVRAAIFNDAGGGKDGAGLGSLAYLDALGIAAATVAHDSARIGDTDDMMARGRISAMNEAAQGVGLIVGMACLEAAVLLTGAQHRPGAAPELGEARIEIAGARSRHIVLVDSASLVLPEDAGRIVVTGSHGGLVGGDPAAALRTEGFAGVFNDAGIGIDAAGVGRLPALDARGIAAFTVSAASARIGEGRSTFEDGIVSRVNVTAAGLGAAEGMRARDVLERWARA